MPFRLISDCPIDEEQIKNEESEELKQLKEVIRRLKEKNVKIANNFQSLQHGYTNFKRDYEEKTRAYEELVRKTKTKIDYTYRIKKDLVAANTKLTMRAQDRNAACSVEHQRYEEIKRDN